MLIYDRYPVLVSVITVTFIDVGPPKSALWSLKVLEIDIWPQLMKGLGIPAIECFILVVWEIEGRFQKQTVSNTFILGLGLLHACTHLQLLNIEKK